MGCKDRSFSKRTNVFVFVGMVLLAIVPATPAVAPVGFSYGICKCIYPDHPGIEPGFPAEGIKYPMVFEYPGGDAECWPKQTTICAEMTRVASTRAVTTDKVATMLRGEYVHGPVNHLKLSVDWVIENMAVCQKVGLTQLHGSMSDSDLAKIVKRNSLQVQFQPFCTTIRRARDDVSVPENNPFPEPKGIHRIGLGGLDHYWSVATEVGIAGIATLIAILTWGVAAAARRTASQVSRYFHDCAQPDNASASAVKRRCERGSGIAPFDVDQR